MHEDRTIQIAHGGGGTLTARLIEEVILPALSSAQDPRKLTDAAMLDFPSGKIAMTTDSYVVEPLEFPGGDIGKLSICGTVNDLAVSGAIPRAISMGLILGEGLEIDLLERVLRSAGREAKNCGVSIVTGDTKVVDRDSLTGMVINTAGVGEMHPVANLGYDAVTAGDAIILSGPLGEHGMAVMTQRKSLGISADLQSDCAAINVLTASLLDELGDDVHFMRDPTRGGLAAALCEISASTGNEIEIVQANIPVNSTARTAAELLGLDLLSAANEGKLIAIVSADAAERAAKLLRRHEIASDSAIIGTIGQKTENPIVELKTEPGGRRIVQMPYGQSLPRIC